MILPNGPITPATRSRSWRCMPWHWMDWVRQTRLMPGCSRRWTWPAREAFTRVFIDLGKPMQEMLERLAKQDHLRGFIPRILAAYPEEDKHLEIKEAVPDSSRLVIRL